MKIKHHSSASHPKTHSKMRKETTALCVFMVFWNIVSILMRNPVVEKCPPCQDYTINESIHITDNCKSCSFVVDNNGTKPNSSERDAILLVAFRKLINLYPFVHSIRTTGCKARIFVFMDKQAAETQEDEFYQQMEECGVQFIKLYEFDPSFLDDVYYYRYIIYHNFLFANKDYLDRVITTDLYDTIAQHDPFTEDFRSDRVYFSNEGYLIKDNDVNLKTLEIAFDGLVKINRSFKKEDVDYHHLIRHPIINGGIQAGGILPFINFSLFMTRIGNPITMDAYGPDQAFLNYFLHTGAFDNIFKYQIDKAETTFLSTIGVYLTDDEVELPKNVDLGNIQRGNKKPALIHQFDRSKTMYNAVLKACPNWFNVVDYCRDRSRM